MGKMKFSKCYGCVHLYGIENVAHCKLGGETCNFERKNQEKQGDEGNIHHTFYELDCAESLCINDGE